MAGLMLIILRLKDILADENINTSSAWRRVNKLVNAACLRDAYKKVGQDIEAGKFSYDTAVHHTHEGSIGNLCNCRNKKSNGKSDQFFSV